MTNENLLPGRPFALADAGAGVQSDTPATGATSRSASHAANQHATENNDTAAAAKADASASPPADRLSFTTDELAVVLSNYDLGTLESVSEFARGSRKSPKALVVSERGKFLLKRRAKGKDDPYRVAFAHALQLHLATRRFPLPHLIGTRRDNNSMLQVRGYVYELFEYIPGQNYSQSLQATHDSGRVLGVFHQYTESFRSQWKSASGSYHDAPQVMAALTQIPASLRADQDPRVRALVDNLSGIYQQCAKSASDTGLSRWPVQTVHADWHPGNMQFRDDQVVAVIDYDSARLLPRVIDIANGALQFSIVGSSSSLDDWPAQLDEARYERFIAGYDSVIILSKGELSAIPFLMAEALIAEAVFPIAATGAFGKLEGLAFLAMVERKVKWLTENAARLSEVSATTLRPEQSAT